MLMQAPVNMDYMGTQRQFGVHLFSSRASASCGREAPLEAHRLRSAGTITIGLIIRTGRRRDQRLNRSRFDWLRRRERYGGNIWRVASAVAARLLQAQQTAVEASDAVIASEGHENEQAFQRAGDDKDVSDDQTGHCYDFHERRQKTEEPSEAHHGAHAHEHPQLLHHLHNRIKIFIDS